jgi:SAM-dependent methyltransferase
MSAYILPPKAYGTPAVASKRDTIIDATPQEYTLAHMTSQVNEFDDLYDISEGEEEFTDIPITISVSNSPVFTRNDKPLVIPDVSSWPSVHTKKTQVPLPSLNTDLLSPRLVVPKMELSNIRKASTQSSSSTTPSLDGSLTSEEMNSMTCPSTPDVNNDEQPPQDWTVPTQLNPASLMTLGCLTVPPKTPDTQLFALQPREMAEKGADIQRLDTDFEIAMTPIEAGELSALSIPSPGGFFSSLDAASRPTWLPSPKPGISSTTAENFYSRPFDTPRRESDALPAGEVSPGTGTNLEDTNFTDGPPTARQIPAHWNCGTPGLSALKSPNQVEEVQEYSDSYETKLREQSSVNLDRTSSWLAAQHPVVTEEVQTYVEPPASPLLDPETPPTPPLPDFPIPKRVDSLQDPTFVRGFEHLQKNQHPCDTFVHRKTRTEKLRLDRKCLFSTHVSQLEGQYALDSPLPRSARLPPNLDTVVEEESAEKVAIATAVREQKALEQIETVSWTVEAVKYLNGGTLLTSPLNKVFPVRKGIRILDLGGVANCDWAWQVCLEHPSATVHTVCLPDRPFDPSIARPLNHEHSVVEELWHLPFPTGYFDGVSARNLHALLRLQKHSRRGGDEYDLVLRECMRVMRPGGYLEFALLDADIMGAGPQGQAMNAEFSQGLKALRYDPAPTKTWLARVRKAGFGQIRRAWLVLPMSKYSGMEGSTADAAHIAGMVGAWAWERWLLKLQKEMGMEEGRLLAGVAGVMEEGARVGGGWRYLSGWARKPC